MRGSRTKLSAAGLLVCGWIVVALQSDGRPTEFRQTVSGALIPSNFDVDEDGNPGVLYRAGASGTFGESTLEGLLEASLLPEPVNCEPGQEERRIIVWSIVQRFESGDLLFSTLAKGGGTSCARPGRRTPFSVQAEINGGTGRFEGATGTYIFEASTVLLLRDPDGVNVLHAARFGEMAGTIVFASD